MRRHEQRDLDKNTHTHTQRQMGVSAHLITQTAHVHKQCHAFRQVRLYTQTSTSPRLSPTIWPTGQVFALTGLSQNMRCLLSQTAGACEYGRRVNTLETR